MPKLLVNLTDAQVQFLVDRADPFSGKSGVVRDLIDSARLGLDKPLTLAERTASEGSGASTSSSTSKKTSFNKEVPPSLSEHTDLIQAFWKAKAGSKSAAGWKLLMTELGKIQEKYGAKVVADQLELATAQRFKGVSLRNYEQFGIGTKAAAKEPEHRHPAYRDASEVLAEQERIAQQNIEHARRMAAERASTGGVLEGLF